MTRLEAALRARSPRRLRRLAAIACLAIAALLMTAAEAAGADSVPQQANPRLNGIDVVQVDGLLDPPTASLVRDAIARANSRRSTMLVLQLDSGGSVDVDVQPLLARGPGVSVPVVVWVGPSGGEGQGRSHADRRGGAPSARCRRARASGRRTPCGLDDPGDEPPGRDRPAGEAGRTVGTRSGRGAPARDREPLRRRRPPRRRGRRRGADAGRADRVARRARRYRPPPAEAAVDGQGHRRGPGPSPSAQPGRALRRLDLGEPGAAHADQPVDRLLPVRRRAGADRVRVLRVRDRSGRPRGRGARSSARWLGFSHLPVHWWAVGAARCSACSASPIDVQAGGLGAWTVIGSAVARGRVAHAVRRVGAPRPAVVGARARHRRHRAVLARRHDGRGPLALLDPDGRARGDGRRGWARPRWPSSPTASS